MTLTQHGDNAAAIEVLDEALTLTTRAGADWGCVSNPGSVASIGGTAPTVSCRATQERLGSLTDTEAAVAHLAAEGNTDKQIAEKLFISPHTAHTHLRHIFEKLGINSRVHLSRFIDGRDPGYSNSHGETNC
jgi:DNA-binding CsgD family transcriptional regulator